ncbi:MAG: FAD-dependent oxidoreductase [Patescibacteria group bacterium]|nr:FAD-dependent oxidoreductase [Patescibacteria group bacterium]
MGTDGWKTDFTPAYDAAIIGGGFFGAVIALYLRRRGLERVIVLEKGPDLLRRASYNNQARIHNGYHYPRNIVTALRSHVNFPRFVGDFRECVDDSFEKVYAVAKMNSKVTGNQFRLFSERIGVPIEPAPAKIKDRFNPDLIEEVFVCKEFAFDPDKLRAIVRRRLREAGVEVRLNTAAERVTESGGGLTLECRSPDGAACIEANLVFNCTYSQINRLLVDSRLPIVPLKHELTELAVVDVPPAMKNLGVTVMCGPFFSCMPFPALGRHTLSHVRYTPHCEWHDREDAEYRDAHGFMDTVERKSAFLRMVKDAERYIPEMSGIRQRDSLWEIKTVLPMNENDDGRPILFRKDHGLKGLTCVMGGKVDNIYDALEELDKTFVKTAVK